MGGLTVRDGKAGNKSLVNARRRFHRVPVWIGVLFLALHIMAAQGWGAEQSSELGPDAEGGTAGEATWQVTSLLSTIPYGAAKVGVALVGGLVGGTAYVLSAGNLENSQEIWSYFLKGTYVLTPEHLKGEKPVHFIGKTPEGDMDPEPAEPTQDP